MEDMQVERVATKPNVAGIILPLSHLQVKAIPGPQTDSLLPIPPVPETALQFQRWHSSIVLSFHNDVLRPVRPSQFVRLMVDLFFLPRPKKLCMWVTFEQVEPLTVVKFPTLRAHPLSVSFIGHEWQTKITISVYDYVWEWSEILTGGIPMRIWFGLTWWWAMRHSWDESPNDRHENQSADSHASSHYLRLNLHS